MEFVPAADRVGMVVTLEPMHNEEFTRMSAIGFTRQLTKFGARLAAA